MEAKIYSVQRQAEGELDLFKFDKEYVDRLRDGEPETEAHFVSYFGQILGIMLRARRLPPERVDDIRQEALTRVIAILRRDGGIREPERFGAFVSSVCKNVLRENARDWAKNQSLQENQIDVPDKIADLERSLISKETKKKVREILNEMNPRDRDLLRAIFLEEKDKDEICTQFGADREYLRVLLYRAKERFRSSFLRNPGRLPRQTAANIIR